VGIELFILIYGFQGKQSPLRNALHVERLNSDAVLHEHCAMATRESFKRAGEVAENFGQFSGQNALSSGSSRQRPTKEGYQHKRLEALQNQAFSRLCQLLTSSVNY
jgi:hypothetical protein